MSVGTSLSLFQIITDAVETRLPPIQATKATLVDVSHLLENIILEERLPAVICTGFQESSHWRAETERYREMAQIAHQICVFAGGTLPLEDDQRQIHVQLRGPDPLRQEWFLLVLTHQFAALLCGRDNLAPVLEEGDRTFATLWSFDPALIGEVLPALSDVVARERPDRLASLDDAFHRFPPPVPDPRYITLITQRLIDDLGRQHQARIRLERVIAHESRLRSLGQVLSGVAHELNNPLQSVLGFGSLLLEDENLDAANHEDVQHIVDAAERARDIVQNLLQFSRPGSETITSVGLKQLVEKTLVFVRSTLNTARIELSVVVEPDVPPIMAHPLRIQQLLINLLTNAIQALAQQDEPRKLLIHLKCVPDSMVQLIVQDNGPGIAPELQQHIFEPFYTTKQIGEGTGLGLSIVKSIVTQHGGQISVTSEVGQGTTFRIQLPIGVEQPAPPTQSVPMVGHGRILLIDDDVQVRAVVQRTLERGGYVVQAEGSARELLETGSLENYAVIVCDLMMPEMDGIQFFEQLSRRQPELVPRLVFMTGAVDRVETQGFLQRTGRPVLTKPFTPALLLTMIREIMEQQNQ